jgi:GDSL-like Lipase/Acylhydrolase family
MSTFVRRGLALVAATGTAAVIVALTGAGAAQASSASYVALGDSYASGVGAGDYTSAGGDCDVSTAAFPYLWDGANSPSSFSDEACSGATTTDVIDNQLGALKSSTSLISLIAGGDNVGFTSVMETCVLDSTSSCVSAIDTAESEAESTLPGQLDTLYSDIKADAPSAHVVVLDYADLYDLSESSGCTGLSTTDRTDLNQAADTLDSVIETQAEDYGFTFVDVRPYFAGHEICDSNAWLHSLNFLDIDESYHPTASGQADGYYPAFEAGVAK